MLGIREYARDSLVLLRTDGCIAGLLSGSYFPRPDLNLHRGVLGEYYLVPSRDEM